MNTDIRISVSFLHHRKRLRLEKELGNGATSHLINLWLNSAMNHPRGTLDGMDATDVALEAGWYDDPQVFIDALQRCGFLETDSNGAFVLHEWEQHQPYAVHAPERSEKARKASKERWSKSINSESKVGSSPTSMLQASSEHARSNTPSPVPFPSPNPKPEEEENAPGKPSTPSASSDCPYQDFINSYSAELRELPKPKILTSKRRRAILTIWNFAKSHGKYSSVKEGLAYWQRYFQNVHNTPYLMGKAPDFRDGKTFQATFDWLVKTENFVKIIEGTYDRRKTPDTRTMYGREVAPISNGHSLKN